MSIESEAIQHPLAPGRDAAVAEFLVFEQIRDGLTHRRGVAGGEEAPADPIVDDLESASQRRGDDRDAARHRLDEHPAI